MRYAILPVLALAAGLMAGAATPAVASQYHC